MSIQSVNQFSDSFSQIVNNEIVYEILSRRLVWTEITIFITYACTRRPI